MIRDASIVKCHKLKSPPPAAIEPDAARAADVAKAEAMARFF